MYFTQQNDATSSWCVGVEVHSHISSVMQTLQSQSIPTNCPLLLFCHSCSISHFISIHSTVNISGRTCLESLFPEVMPAWQCSI